MKQVNLRGWQQSAFIQFKERYARGERSLLWEATPGSGKTTAALHVAREQLARRRVARVVVVVPTAHLKLQWARAAHAVGLELDTAFASTRSRLSPDYHGVVVTYQQIGNRRRLFKEFGNSSMVILDEVHHAADGLTWGDALLECFGTAPFILCLSGTAFRSDSNAIPFVHYDAQGDSVADYSYTYSQAVSEQVCRPSAFFFFGGEVSWEEGSRTYSARFDEALDAVQSARRLRASLEPEAGWIQPMLHEAQRMLQSVRNSHSKAGGLIVCVDQQHARKIALELTPISGEKPVVVLSDDRGASKKIKDFAESSAPWIIACNMVSEGVDIPRLRIGVYATTVRTKMYFRQFLGRIVRRQAGVTGTQIAYMYLPADPWLQHLAEEVEQETRHALRKRESEFEDNDRVRRKSDERDDRPSWSAVSSINSGLDAVVVHGNQLSFLPSAAPTEVQELIEREIMVQRESSLSRSETKQQLCNEIKRMVSVLNKRSGKPHSSIHLTLNRTQRVQSQIHCTEQQLRARIKLLEEMVYSRKSC